MDILVVGANGLVGSRLVRHLASQGHAVTGAGRGPLRGPAPVAAYHPVDVGDAERLVEVVSAVTPEVVINCAAMTDVDGCERAPVEAYLANAHGPAALARACRATQCHLVHVSTDYVFDGEGGPYAPEAVPSPRGVYATTKLAGELAVRAVAPAERWTIARTAVVYGWPPAGQKNFGSWLYSSLKAGQAVKLFEDQWVSPSLALSVAEMVGELAVRRLPGVWHTSGAEVLDRVTLGRRFCDFFGFDPALVQPSRMADLKLASPRPRKSGLDVAATAAALAHRPLGFTASLERFRAELLAAGEVLPR